ncbi:MAG: hypothetical protein J6Z45_03335 [Oscillospiraceae bacterium]|nr:hypothetical protein [Oscillospiraceae bacterium]
MKEQKILAARLIADRVAEINAELDRELASAEPDWDRVELLSAEAAACLASDEQADAGRKALFAALPAALPAERKLHPMRWFRYAAAAAVAAIALFAVPAAIRHNHSLRQEPAVTDSVMTETTAVTDSTAPASSVSSSENVTESASSETKTTASSETGTTASYDEAKTTASSETTGTASGSTQESRVTISSVTTSVTRQTAVTTVSTASSQSGSVPPEVTAEYTADRSETSPVYSGTSAVTEKWKFGRNSVQLHASGDQDSSSGKQHAVSVERENTSERPVTVYLSVADEQYGDPLLAEAQIIGAVLEISRMDGTLVCRWTTGGAAQELHLDASQTYRLHMVSVPPEFEMPLRDSVFVPDSAHLQSCVFLRRKSAGEEAQS